MAAIINSKGDIALNHYRIIATTLLFLTMTVHASVGQQVWISDELQTSVIAAPEYNAKFIGTLRSGESAKEIGRSKDGEYVHIKTSDIDGWVSARNVMKTPSVQAKYLEQTVQLKKLQEQNQKLKQSNADSTNTLTTLKTQLEKLTATEQNAKDELVALKRVSGNAIAIDKHNQELQAAVVSLEQEVLSLKHKNLRLEEKIAQKQMYAGGLLVLAGFMLHWLSSLFRFNNRRRNSFDEL